VDKTHSKDLSKGITAQREPLVVAGRLKRQKKVEQDSIEQSGEIISVAGRIIRRSDEPKTFGGSIAVSLL